MPIFEFKCDSCGKAFEQIVTSKENPICCPACKSSKVSKQMSACSFKSSGQGSSGPAVSTGCGSCTSKNCGSCS